MPDTAACYVLMDRQGEFIDVHQWFAAFAALHPAPRQSAITSFFAKQNATSPAGKRKERGRPAAVGAPTPPRSCSLSLGLKLWYLAARACRRADSCEPAE
jgi:hypothetical protein